MDFTVAGLWNSMGLAAKAVFIILAFLSIYSIAVMIERGVTLRRTRRQCREFADFLAADTPDMTMGTVTEYAKQPERGPHCYLAQVVGQTLRESRARLDRGQDPAIVLAAAAGMVSRGINLTSAALRKRLVHLASTSAGAPFVGLFGTVLGLIRAFQQIAVTGSGGIAAVAGGIAEALVTTLMGLFVAIPALWAHNFFADHIDLLMIELDASGSEAVDRLLQREADARVAKGA
jgi:biopolymer transport protein ExbB/TolQ